ncbi:MAG: hypothetical protein ACYTHM_13955 [Planctomycetota bacterium]|jgi:hypothetical protein
MMDRNKQFVVLGLLSTVVFLLVLLFIGYQREDALAQEAPVRTGPPNILAVTGACGVGAEIGVLYVIDAEKKQMAIYSAFGGRNIQFVAARKIYYDLEVMAINDDTPKRFSVPALKKVWDQLHKKDTGKGPSRRRR